MRRQTKAEPVAVSAPGEAQRGIRVRSEHWRGYDAQQRCVFLPKDVERFARSGFVPNITVTVADRGQLPDPSMSAPTNSELAIGRSLWETETATCEEELTITPLGTTTLVQLRAVLARGDLRAEVVATLLDQDLADIGGHIRGFISKIEFTETVDVGLGTAEDKEAGR